MNIILILLFITIAILCIVFMVSCYFCVKWRTTIHGESSEQTMDGIIHIKVDSNMSQGVAQHVHAKPVSVQHIEHHVDISRPITSPLNVYNPHRNDNKVWPKYQQQTGYPNTVHKDVTIVRTQYKVNDLDGNLAKSYDNTMNTSNHSNVNSNVYELQQIDSTFETAVTKALPNSPMHTIPDTTRTKDTMLTTGSSELMYLQTPKTHIPTDEYVTSGGSSLLASPESSYPKKKIIRTTHKKTPQPPPRKHFQQPKPYGPPEIQPIRGRGLGVGYV